MRFLFLLATLFLSQMCHAQAIEELPLYVKFKDVPLEENPVGGYATFGTFTDGLPAIEVVSPNVVSFFERAKLTPIFPYQRNQINCKLGLMKTVAMGDSDKIRNMPNMPNVERVVAINLLDTHPLNFPVYEKICKAVGFKLNLRLK